MSRGRIGLPNLGQDLLVVCLRRTLKISLGQGHITLQSKIEKVISLFGPVVSTRTLQLPGELQLRGGKLAPTAHIAKCVGNNNPRNAIPVGRASVNTDTTLGDFGLLRQH